MPVVDNVKLSWDGGKKLHAILAKWKESPAVRVGILEGATYSGEIGTKSKPGQSVATVAFWQEYGTKRGTPSRPFMRLTVANNKEKWSKAVVSMLRAGRSPKQAAEALGMVAVADMIQTIENGVPPPSAPSTVAYKRKRGKVNPDTPLVDTGTMEQSIAFEVIEQ